MLTDVGRTNILWENCLQVKLSRLWKKHYLGSGTEGEPNGVNELESGKKREETGKKKPAPKEWCRRFKQTYYEKTDGNIQGSGERNRGDECKAPNRQGVVALS